jgi:hypothetical protein
LCKKIETYSLQDSLEPPTATISTIEFDFEDGFMQVNSPSAVVQGDGCAATVDVTKTCCMDDALAIDTVVDNRVEDVQVKLASVEEEIAALKSSLQTLESKDVAAEVVGPITQVVNNKFELHEQQIQELTAASSNHDQKMDRWLNLLEDSMRQFKASGDNVKEVASRSRKKK